MDRVFAQDGFLRGNTAMILGDGRVVFARRVDVRMSQHIGNEINISCFTVKIGAEGAAELMRADFLLERRGNRRIFFDHVFNGALRDPPPLNRQKEGVFMAGKRLDFLALRQIVLERVRDLVGKV